MNPKTLLALALLGCLAAFVWWQQDARVERGIERFSMKQVDLSVIDSIEVTGDNPIVLEKKGGEWFLSTGRLAQQSAVKRAVEAFQKMESSTVLATEVTPSILTKWGLDEEQATSVVLKGQGKVVSEIKLGKVTAGRVPLLVNGTLFSAKGVFPGVFAKPMQSWIEKRLFIEAKKSLKMLSYEKADQPIYSLVPTDSAENEYEFSKAVALPTEFRFDTEMARSVASSLVSLRAQSFIEKELDSEVTGLGPTSDRVRFEYEVGSGAGTKSDVLILGGPAEGNGTYARLQKRNDTFVISASTAKLFRKSVEDFRSLRFMNFDPSKAARLSIKDGRTRISWVKKEGTWSLEHASEKMPKDFELDGSLVERRLRRLADAKALGLAPLTPAAGLKGARASLRVTLEDSSEVEMKVGRKTSYKGEAGFYVGGNADESVYVITEASRRYHLGMLSSFEKKEAPRAPQGLGNLDPAALSKLPPNIRQQILQQLRAQEAANRK